MVSATCLLLLPALWNAFGEYGTLLARSSSFWPVISGVVLGALVEGTLLRRAPVLAVAEHELTHAVVALLFLRPVRRLYVSRHGGYVEHGPGPGGILGDEAIGLAPYFLPTFTLLSLLVRPLIPPEWSTAFAVWLGATVGYHVVSTAHELRDNFSNGWFRTASTGELVQTDIGRRGRAYSAIFIVTGTLSAYGVSLAILLGGARGAWTWARLVGSRFVDVRVANLV